jgi:hypothetical protein
MLLLIGKMAKNATKLDPIYSWAAYNALSLIGIVKDGYGVTELKQVADAAKVKCVIHRHRFKNLYL